MSPIRIVGWPIRGTPLRLSGRSRSAWTTRSAAIWRAEPRSKVAFDIEDVGHGTTKVTITHDGFEPGSAVLPAISEGWPAVLASLKTLLETGAPLRTT